MIQQDEVLHSLVRCIAVCCSVSQCVAVRVASQCVAVIQQDEVLHSFVAHVKHDAVLLEHVKCTLAHENANACCVRMLEFCVFLHAIATI